MTFKEFVKISAILKAAYTSEKLLKDTYSLNVWYKLLEDLDYNTVGIAIQKYISTNKFPPTIADIRELCAISQDEELTDSEAWSRVQKAIRNSTYNSKGEYEKLPDNIKRAVGSSNQLKCWATDEDFNEGVIASNFKKTYRQLSDRAKTNNALPTNLKTQIETISNKLALEADDD